MKFIVHLVNMFVVSQKLLLLLKNNLLEIVIILLIKLLLLNLNILIHLNLLVLLMMNLIIVFGVKQLNQQPILNELQTIQQKIMVLLKLNQNIELLLKVNLKNINQTQCLNFLNNFVVFILPQKVILYLIILKMLIMEIL